MEPPGAAAGLAPKRRGPGPAPPRMAEPRPLFDDTSGGAAPPSPPHGPARAYGAPPAAPPASSASRLPPPAAAFLAEPVSSLAAAYGSSLASQGRDIVDRNHSLHHGLEEADGVLLHLAGRLAGRRTGGISALAWLM
ncbi:protein YIF1B-like isoform X1 [Anas platyrhynchos]|uniref:protein YIF1B-like isoform X1 n=1 Tax=Anas platyrhynchos TaxID=8839 RepID=UPI003AF23D11